MKKMNLFLLTVLGAALLLSGCGSKAEEEETTTLELKKNGEIVQSIIEDFSESYYDLDELKSTTESMIAGYNESAGSDNIKLQSAEVTDGVVHLVMTFRKSEDYTGLYRQALFFNAGYDLDITLNSVKEEGATINKQDILDMGEKHIAVVRETTTVKTYGDILYISDDVTMGPDDRTATVTNGESLSYIIFK